MVGRLATRNFCGDFLYTKKVGYMGRLVEWGDWRFILFLGSPLEVLEICDKATGLLIKGCRFEMCGETYFKG